jgi:hypothetical protein
MITFLLRADSPLGYGSLSRSVLVSSAYLLRNGGRSWRMELIKHNDMLTVTSSDEEQSKES